MNEVEIQARYEVIVKELGKLRDAFLEAYQIAYRLVDLQREREVSELEESWKKES